MPNDEGRDLRDRDPRIDRRRGGKDGEENVLRSDQCVADCVDGGFASGHGIELEEDGANVLGGGTWADEETLGDLPIRPTVHQQTQHVQFTR
jgi:hypothetical protein